MRALVTGGGGQLGAALARAAPAGWAVTGLSRDQLDIGDPEAVRAILSTQRPDLVFNAAAYTAVDRAETEAEEAYRANRDGPGYLAHEATRIGAALVHVSTDFVFDGALGRPYRPGDEPRPLGVYGASKLAGEAAVLASDANALIVRTAWVYAASGRNFLNTMLRLMENNRAVRVVVDQVGSPTSADCLADALWGLARAGARGVMHFTNAGVASWYDFAVAIAEESRAGGLIKTVIGVTPISTSEYPTPARRPPFSVLDCTAAWTALGGPPSHWRAALRDVLRSRRGS